MRMYSIIVIEFREYYFPLFYKLYIELLFELK